MMKGRVGKAIDRGGNLFNNCFSGDNHDVLGLSEWRMGDVSEIALTLSLPNRPETYEKWATSAICSASIE